ncbi:MAG: hypothetical protein ABI168_09715 [Ginsengibacter sp.]
MNILSSLKNIIPENLKGKSSDIEHSILADDNEEARNIFQRAAKRMLNLNIWAKLGGFPSAEFVLSDDTGQKIHRLAALGDFIRIDIQGPGSSAGNGFDWVTIEALDPKSDANTNEEGIGMRVRACHQPGKEPSQVAHFFTRDATSTFIIYRNHNTVKSFYHGRNEVLNTDVDNMLDKIRNVVMGGIALAAISEIQWNTLIKSFLEQET